MYELAVIIAGLGVTFLLAYIGLSLQSDNPIFIGGKILLILLALLMAFYPLGFSVSLIDAYNETSANHLDNGTYATLNNMAGKQMSAYQKIFYSITALGLIALIYFIFLGLKSSTTKGTQDGDWNMPPFRGGQ